MPGQTAGDLVDGLAKEEEEVLSYSHYYGSARHRAYSPGYR